MEAAKKNIFLNGRAIKALTPLPPSLMAVGKRILTIFFLPAIFGPKEPYFAKYCNKPVKDYDFANHCQY